MKNIFLITIILIVFSCKKKLQKKETLFVLKKNTGITFANILKETEQLNPYTYKNFYNGGGVAIGDINNDGLEDILFTGNQEENHLYLNKGNFTFEDITQKAGVACAGVWSAGATFVDVNYDGLLDIYICKAGPPSTNPNRHNELFINNGNLTFTEQSKKYGLDITGLSVQSNFFDYDKDGDLDCYLLNNSIRSVGNYDLIKNERLKRVPNGNKLLKNDKGVFIDVSEEANIYSSAIGFGLGITVSDFNKDTWPDIFISNDFFERDYYYLNQKDGTFKESIVNQFESLSMGSMGADAADLNNDGFIDIVVTEMLPKTIDRQRTKTLFESWNKYSFSVQNEYHHQFSRNALHRNMGNNFFYEISRFTNTAASEWSWGSLIFDADNDGLKDIFISNGIAKDLLDRDYLTYMADKNHIKNKIINQQDAIIKLLDLMPSKPVSNIIYKNTGNFNFEETTTQWGLAKPSFSNGSAYADLDNDGDLDLIVNNVNMPAFVYENKTNNKKNKNICIQLIGSKQNTKAVGAKAEIYYNNTYSVLENFPSKGFQSTSTTKLIFGVGNVNSIDSLKITWPNGKINKFKNLITNKKYVVNDSVAKKEKTPLINSILRLKKTPPFFKFQHKENKAVDFNKEQLLPEMHNNEGPNIASADINDDGIIDYYIGGAKGQVGTLFVSDKNTYNKITNPFHKNKNSEDTDAVFFDSDNDGDLDLYVASGGKSFSKFDYALNDRLYINDGKANFTLLQNAFQFKNPISTATVAVSDYDLDGDLDIFVGERFKTETYGIPASGYLLINKGQNKYVVTAPKTLQNIGLITDAVWYDINNDTLKDLIVVGEWMPISIFINSKGKLENKTEQYKLKNTKGFWKTIKLADFNKDGKIDFIVGNKGTNTFFKEGLRMYISDFDKNGFKDQIICYKINNKYYPIVDRDELISQLPYLKQKFLFYKDYAHADIEAIFTKKQLKKAKVLEVNNLKTTMFINKNNTFEQITIPNEIQYSNVEAIEVFDVNKDGYLDIFLGGNQYLVKPQFGIQDASKGWLLYGTENTQFLNPYPLGINGQIRDFKIIQKNNKNYLITTINDKEVQFYEIK